MFAHKLARSKTAIDEMGKGLVVGIKAQAKAIDAERARTWEAIEAIQHEVRKPLTEWEEKEEARIKGHEEALAKIAAQLTFTGEPSAAEIEAHVSALIEIGKGRDWQEFALRAQEAHGRVYSALLEKLKETKKRDEERAELARLQAAEVVRMQKERDEQLQREAAEDARREAEAKARLEKQAIEAEAAKKQKELEDKNKLEKERADKAEADKKTAEQQAARNLEAQVKAGKEAQQKALEDERRRVDDQKKKVAEAEAQRAKNVEHMGRIHREILSAVKRSIVDLFANDANCETAAKRIVEAMAKGKIPHTKIIY